MNCIMSLSFHTRKHAHVLEIIDQASKEHPTTNRSKVVRNLVIQGAEYHLLEQLLDECEAIINASNEREFGDMSPYRWRKDLIRRKQREQT